MVCPTHGLGVRCSAPKLSGSGFEAGTVRVCLLPVDRVPVSRLAEGSRPGSDTPFGLR